MIDEKKAIEEVRLMDFTTIASDGIEYVRKDMVVKLINNQPQVQPIVRSLDAVAKMFVRLCECEGCEQITGKCAGLHKPCNAYQRWIAWLTGKEV